MSGEGYGVIMDTNLHGKVLDLCLPETTPPSGSSAGVYRSPVRVV
ncbi:hypothetical protein [Methanosarcina sp.]|jgi:hypothetical protein|nr:hypothetical protein [Methanosarcina sp.]HOW13782.1 hypothetical protein [Methanosarcina sp.]